MTPGHQSSNEHNKLKTTVWLAFIRSIMIIIIIIRKSNCRTILRGRVSQWWSIYWKKNMLSKEMNRKKTFKFVNAQKYKIAMNRVRYVRDEIRYEIFPWKVFHFRPLFFFRTLYWNTMVVKFVRLLSFLTGISVVCGDPYFRLIIIMIHQ